MDTSGLFCEPKRPRSPVCRQLWRNAVHSLQFPSADFPFLPIIRSSASAPLPPCANDPPTPTLTADTRGPLEDQVEQVTCMTIR
jgi:hypothetical protein